MIFPQRMIDASADVRDHEDLGFLPVAIECALKQRLMFARGDFAAEHHRDHLIAKVAVVYQCACVDSSTSDPQSFGLLSRQIPAMFGVANLCRENPRCSA